MKKLAILIPTLESRIDNWHNLLEQLTLQISKLDAHDRVEIISNIDNGEKTIGQKRNELIKLAINGGFDYVVFFDDDDNPMDKYIYTLLKGINYGADVVSLRGLITIDGGVGEIFEHSIRYSAYKTNTSDSHIKYERYPNHLNCMKLSVAKKFKFPEINHGEDTNFATQVYRSGLLKKEYFTNDIIYHYNFKTKK